MKTPEERAREEYYTRKDIMIVLKVSRDVAERIFQNAHKRDEETLARGSCTTRTRKSDGSQFYGRRGRASTAS